MFLRLYLEDIAAGAFLQKSSVGRKILTYDELEDFGRRVVARLKSEGHNAEMRLSRDLTNKMYANYGDFFKEALLNGSFGVELVEGKTPDDILDKFMGVLAFPVMQAMYVEPLVCKAKAKKKSVDGLKKLLLRAVGKADEMPPETKEMLQSVCGKGVPSVEDYRLCYVAGGIMYFTDNFENQWGDDWDDIPYEHNADPPYEYDESLSPEINEDRGHIVIGAWFDKEWRVGLPCDNTRNSEYSVAGINKGAVPWLSLYNEKGLMGGATVAETRKWCRKHGICFALFDEGKDYTHST